jgi:hypothetical protein
MVKTCQHLFSLLIYAVFVPFFSLMAEIAWKYPLVLGNLEPKPGWKSSLSFGGVYRFGTAFSYPMFALGFCPFPKRPLPPLD